MSKRIRTKVFCYCKKCNGALVDPRTKLKHTTKYQSSIAGPSRAVAEPSGAEPFGVNQSDAEPSGAEPSDAKPSDAEPSDAEPSDAKPAINYDEMEWDPIERLSKRNNIFLTKKLPHESAKRKEKYPLLFSKIFWMMKAIKMMTIIIIQIVKKRNIMMMMRRRRKRRRSTLCYIRLKDRITMSPIFLILLTLLTLIIVLFG